MDKWRCFTPDRGETSADDSPWKGVGTLIVICVISLSALGIMILDRICPKCTAPVESALNTRPQVREAAFHGGIAFGMSRARAARLRPDMRITPAAGGETAGSFSANGARLTVAFLGARGGERAYRIRSVQTIDQAEERAVLDNLLARFGAPVINDCAKWVLGSGDLCRYRWLAPGGISVDLASRTIPAAPGLPNVRLTIVARDSYLDGKRGRAKPASL